MHMVLYTDGSFRNGICGWGIHGYTWEYTAGLMPDGSVRPTDKGYSRQDSAVAVVEQIDGYGNVKDGTSNVGELTAVIKAMELARDKQIDKLLVYSDSQYVVKCFKLLNTWKRNSWITRSGTAVANIDLWKQIDSLYSERKGKFKLEWIRGHAGNKGNIEADRNASKSTDGSMEESLLIVPMNESKTIKVEPNSAINPMVHRSNKLLFMVSPNPVNRGSVYAFYNLRVSAGTTRTEDTLLDKLNKTDLLLGANVGGITYTVLRPKEPITYLDNLANYHANKYSTEFDEPAIINLTNALKPDVKTMIETKGPGFLSLIKLAKACVTPDSQLLISKTLTPPRQAFAALSEINRMDSVLKEYMENPSKNCFHEVTEYFFKQGAVLDVKNSLIINKVNLRIMLLETADYPCQQVLSKLAKDKMVKVILYLDNPGGVIIKFDLILVTKYGSMIMSAPYSTIVNERVVV